jgi:hypothetical protein
MRFTTAVNIIMVAAFAQVVKALPLNSITPATVTCLPPDILGALPTGVGLPGELNVCQTSTVSATDAPTSTPTAQSQFETSSFFPASIDDVPTPQSQGATSPSIGGTFSATDAPTSTATAQSQVETSSFFPASIDDVPTPSAISELSDL